MSILLDLLYLVLLAVAAPRLLYGAWRHGKYRSGYAARLLGRVPVRSGNRPCLWLHAVSVGEVNLLRPLIDRWQAVYPDWEIAISTTTKTGYELACQKYAPHTVFYCPLDFSWAAREAVRRVRPDLLVLAELELWPNLIHAAKQAGCRIAIVNGRLSARSYRGYRWLRPWIGRVLRNIDRIAVQNDEYADRFRRLGAAPQQVRITGSVKFDGVQLDRHNAQTQRLRQLAGIAPGDVVFLAGSTQAPEEELAIETFRSLREQLPQLRLILVPRHTTRAGEIAALLDRCGLPWERRTALDHSPPRPQARILLVDTIGELAAWWGTAQIAFVGGSLGSRGGQNMIEPAAYGAAVCFGPNTRNFRDIVALLLAHDTAVVVRNGAELTAFVRRCADQPAWAAARGQRAQQLVQAQQGAADLTIDLLRSLVPLSTRSQAA